MYDLIREHWPDYRVEDARATAARLSIHFKDHPIRVIIKEAEVRWENGRSVYAKGTLHGYLYNFFSNYKDKTVYTKDPNYKQLREQQAPRRGEPTRAIPEPEEDIEVADADFVKNLLKNSSVGARKMLSDAGIEETGE